MADVGKTTGREGTQPVSGCFVKLGWLAGGNVLLIALAVGISRQPVWTMTLLDLAFWVVVAVVILLRYLDVARFGGRTMEGEPATLRHVMRYARGLTGAAALLWTLAQSVHQSA